MQDIKDCMVRDFFKYENFVFSFDPNGKYKHNNHKKEFQSNCGNVMNDCLEEHWIWYGSVR